MTMPDQKVVYVDMDHTLCDLSASYLKYKEDSPQVEFPHSIPGFFSGLAPMPNAIEVYHWLSNQDNVDLYILTAPSIRNPSSYTEKRLWVEKHLGVDAAYKLIINPNKGLNLGHFLIDDYTEGKGQESFEGKLLQFGSSKYPDWKSIHRFFERELN
jgi:5'(3')-deoxyribonucleotidase